MNTLIWHDKFRNDWMCAFPLGNGRIGAMVYGNPFKETIEINEESLWSGRQIPETCNSSPEALSKIRSLLFEEKFEEAADLCSETFLANPCTVRFYESFGEIFIDFKDKAEYTDYRKELDLEGAIAGVSYRKNGAVSGICEMIVQSHRGSPDTRITELLPALPEEWSNGKFSGIKIRGNFVLDVEWNNRKLRKLTVKALCDNTFRLLVTDKLFSEKQFNIKDSVLYADFLSGETAVFTCAE